MFNSMFGRLTGNSSAPKETEEEKSKVFEENFIELKSRCNVLFSADPSQTHTESSMRRFLRAFGTIDNAFNHIVKYNKWRREYGVDRLSSEDPDILEEMAVGKVHLLRTRDLKGRPIIHIAARKHIANERDLDKLTKYTIYMLELTCQRIDESVIDNMCIVFDLKNFCMANMDYQFVKKLIWLLGRYYPERLGICLIVNAPVMFSGCWTIIRPWLNEVTASKVTFVNGEEQLCEYLNPDGLPPSDV
ncbi:CRAL-TRIO domain-containing protein C3H8.02 [Aplysia californica]|uniref:CRAL-TRIO domain-containing protein C3H8.02 n=1 Tax=Aplysia californica TaxID=6500 RepID=A0ABM1A8C2_APLCA|nr:CRAL-TRIO domain-containing protein C3H8.02 [Aplysia californica]